MNKLFKFEDGRASLVYEREGSLFTDVYSGCGLPFVTVSLFKGSESVLVPMNSLTDVPIFTLLSSSNATTADVAEMLNILNVRNEVLTLKKLIVEKICECAFPETCSSKFEQAYGVSLVSIRSSEKLLKLLSAVFGNPCSQLFSVLIKLCGQFDSCCRVIRNPDCIMRDTFFIEMLLFWKYSEEKEKFKLFAGMGDLYE